MPVDRDRDRDRDRERDRDRDRDRKAGGNGSLSSPGRGGNPARSGPRHRDWSRSPKLEQDRCQTRSPAQVVEKATREHEYHEIDLGNATVKNPGSTKFCGLRRICTSLGQDSDALRYELEELRCVQKIMIEGHPETVARLLLQFREGELKFRNKFLSMYLIDKVKSVEKHAPTVFDTHMLGEMEANLTPVKGADGRSETREDALHRAQGHERLINVYGRSSTGTLVKMGDEMANISNIIATKESLTMKLLTSTISLVYLFGQWYFKADDAE